MVEKKRSPVLPLTPEVAEAEAAALWAEYRIMHDQGASGAEIEALRKRVSSVLARVKKLTGRSTTTQQLQDLATYVKRLAPKPAGARRVTVEELEREAAQIEAEVARPSGTSPVAPALLARVRRLLAILEQERAHESDDADEDHDEFVGVEERLWDLKSALERASRPLDDPRGEL